LYTPMVLFDSLANLVGPILRISVFVIIGRCVVSWVNASRWNPLVQFLYNATEPVLRPMRRLLPFLQMGIDLTPWALTIPIAFGVPPKSRAALLSPACLFR